MFYRENPNVFCCCFFNLFYLFYIKKPNVIYLHVLGDFQKNTTVNRIILKKVQHRINVRLSFKPIKPGVQLERNDVTQRVL